MSCTKRGFVLIYCAVLLILRAGRYFLIVIYFWRKILWHYFVVSWILSLLAAWREMIGGVNFKKAMVWELFSYMQNFPAMRIKKRTVGKEVKMCWAENLLFEEVYRALKSGRCLGCCDFEMNMHIWGVNGFGQVHAVFLFSANWDVTKIWRASSILLQSKE